MNKKVKYLLLFVVLLAAACTNEIGLMPSSEPSKLVINALLSTDGSQNRIYLHRSGWDEIPEVTDGIIYLYVNGEKVETITARPATATETGQVYYQVNSRFKTGDKVRIEASTQNGDYQAEAETTVEAPIRILQVDTATIQEPSNWGGYYEGLRIQIELQLPDQKGKKYFRLQPVATSISQTTHIESRKDTTFISQNNNFDAKNDIALTDGQPNNGNTDSGIEIFPPLLNYFGIFSDTFFKDGHYKMTFTISYPWNYIPEEYVSQSSSSFAEIQLFSISEEEYMYLKSLSLYIDTDDSSPLETPVIIPGNIKKGLGIFAIENKTSYHFDITAY